MTERRRWSLPEYHRYRRVGEPKAPPAREEQDTQRAIVQWLELVLRPDVRFWHTPNGGARSRIEGGILKGLGVKAGVPDLVFIWPDPSLSGPRVGFMEVKAARGSLSPEQRGFREWCRESDIPFEVVRSLDEAQLLVREWGLTR